MGIEIERKFLVMGDDWRTHAVGQRYCQGYIQTQGTTTVRVRIAGKKGYLTLKGPTDGVSRLEFEYEIPIEEADQMLQTLCDRPLIEKVRYLVVHEGLQWEVDEFLGDNQGLIMAEIELADPNQSFARPQWLGLEVSGDRRYFNSNLAAMPFSQWPRPPSSRTDPATNGD